MSETKSNLKPWTDAEKLGILFQVIEKAGSIPWEELQLPDGRTKRAVQNMIDREKTKAKKALTAEANNETPPESHTKGGKRKVKNLKDAEGDEGGASPGTKKQKPRASRKKATATAAAKAGEDDDEEKANREGEDGSEPATIPVKPNVDMEGDEEAN